MNIANCKLGAKAPKKMTLELSPELESIIADRARVCGTTPERYVEQIVTQHVREYLPQPIEPVSSSSVEEKLKRIKAIARDCGISLSDEQLSRGHMYD